MTRKLPAFYRDASLREIQTRVAVRGENEHGLYVALTDTVLYPEGGGQPADHGTVDGIAVLDVQHGGDGIRHFVDRFPESDDVRVELDWARRFDHMQQHSGQHLLSAIAEDRFGWRTTAFHLGARDCDVELDTAGTSAAALEELEETCARAIREARPITPRWVSLDEYSALKVRSRGLPTGHQGDVRLVEIEGVDLNTCGGTHVSNTAELQAIALLGTEPMRGGVRLTFLVGGRVSARLRDRERTVADLRRALGVADDELVGRIEHRAREAKAQRQRLRGLEQEYASALEAQLRRQLADPGTDQVLAVHTEHAGSDCLRAATRSLANELHSRIALLTSAADGAFLLVLGADHRAHGDAILSALAEPLQARGGGKGAFLQGRAAKLDHEARSEAVAALQSVLA